MILVTGATGNVGKELVGALVNSGAPVRALTHNADQQLPPGVEGLVGDLNQPESLTAGLTGVQGVFLMPGYQDMTGILDEIRRAGVEHVTLLSGGSAVASDLNNAISQYTIDSENAVRDSGVAWTILRPYGFMSNALLWAPQLETGDLIRAPFAAVPVAVIDPFDIAAVAALSLRSPGHEGKRYRLSGPEPLLSADRVRTLGTVLDRELRFQAQSDEEAYAEMAATLPSGYADAFFSFSVGGTLDESEVLSTVRDVTGVPPRTFAQWATAHAEAFR